MKASSLVERKLLITLGRLLQTCTEDAIRMTVESDPETGAIVCCRISEPSGMWEVNLTAFDDAPRHH